MGKLVLREPILYRSTCLVGGNFLWEDKFYGSTSYGRIISLMGLSYRITFHSSEHVQEEVLHCKSICLVEDMPNRKMCFIGGYVLLRT